MLIARAAANCASSSISSGGVGSSTAPDAFSSILGFPLKMAMNSAPNALVEKAPPRVSSLLTRRSSLHSRSELRRVAALGEQSWFFNRLKRLERPDIMPPYVRKLPPNIAAAVASSRFRPPAPASRAIRS